MTKKFKKTLFGYNPSLVDAEIEHINAEFEEQYKILMGEIRSAETERDNLKARIEEVEGGIVSIKSVEPEIGNMLARAHLDASFEIYNSIKKFRLAEKEKVQTIAEYKNRCTELDKDINRAMDNVQSLASI